MAVPKSTVSCSAPSKCTAPAGTYRKLPTEKRSAACRSNWEPLAQSQLSARDDKVRSGDVGVRLVPHARRDEEGVGEADTGLT